MIAHFNNRKGWQVVVCWVVVVVVVSVSNFAVNYRTLLL
jgi:hypothetical protein